LAKSKGGKAEKSREKRRYNNQENIAGYGWRASWINDLQRVNLENGVNRASSGRCLVERVLGQLAEAAPGILGKKSMT